MELRDIVVEVITEAVGDCQSMFEKRISGSSGFEYFFARSLRESLEKRLYKIPQGSVENVSRVLSECFRIFRDDIDEAVTCAEYSTRRVFHMELDELSAKLEREVRISL